MKKSDFKVPIKEMSVLQDGKYAHSLAVAKVAKKFSSGHTEETVTKYKKVVPKAIYEVAMGVRPYYFSYNRVQVNMPEDRIYWKVYFVENENGEKVPVFEAISREEFEEIKNRSKASAMVKPGKAV